jgi:hypothetical protein
MISIDVEELAAALAKKLREGLSPAGSAASYLNRKEAAAYLGISERTLDKLPLPRVAVTETCYRFRRLDLDRFAAERLRD